MRKTVLTLVAAFVVGALCVPLAWFIAGQSQRAAAVTPPGKPVWSEVEWPFLMDQWGKGKAFQCKAADCGTDVNLYLRAKIGFCNCTTGVSDDDELSRVGDIGLIGVAAVTLAPGRAARGPGRREEGPHPVLRRQQAAPARRVRARNGAQRTLRRGRRHGD